MHRVPFSLFVALPTDAALSFTDYNIGQLLQALDETGKANETVVVSYDHCAERCACLKDEILTKTKNN